MGKLLGFLYVYLWYSSILAGYVGLFCFIIPLLLISNRLYRFAADVIFTFWQFYPTALLQFLCGCEIQVTGDALNAHETSILISNHRTRTDWNFLWPTFYHSVVGQSYVQRISYSNKFVLKDVIRHIPGPGWVMQLACFLFIKRNWKEDQKALRQYSNYVTALNYKHSIVVFPEGTDLTENTRESSKKYAETNNLQIYKNVIHPRTTGFSYLAHQLMENNAIHAVYDVTIIYPDTVPQNEKFLLNGCFPKVVKVHLIRSVLTPQNLLYQYFQLLPGNDKNNSTGNSSEK